MEYKVLTAENQRDLLKKRTLDYEISHFQAECENLIASVQTEFGEAMDEVKATTAVTVAGYEQALKWCHTKLDELEAKFAAEQQS